MSSEHSPAKTHIDASPARQSEASHYVAMVAHELRTPLMPILNAATLLARSPHEAHLVRRSAAIIERQARVIGRLVEDLMNVSSIQMGRFQLSRAPIMVTELVRQCLETIAPLATRLDVRQTASEPGEPIELFADGLRLGQALQNVLFNAVKYSQPGGEIRLRTERAGDEILITVSDDGIGIPTSDLESIFELFRQGDSRHVTGLGIGLYLARQMIEAHGGSIVATSGGPGLGSTFSIRIPHVAAEVSGDDRSDARARSRSDSVFTTW